MDNELGANDPYQGMDTGEKEIRPDFLTGNSNAARQVFGAAEQLASLKGGGAKASGAGAGAGKGAMNGGKEVSKKAGSKGISEKASGDKSATKKAQEGEETAGGLYNKNRDASTNSEDKKSGLNMPASIKMMAPFLIILVAIMGLIGLMIALPVMMIGAIDYNLQKALGFENTVGILEEQGEHVTAELAKNGKFPSQYSADLALNGVDVGQVTASGDFIKTDTYIANIEDRDDLVAAASGFSYISEDEGELALLYNGEIIRADDFVAKVESDPTLYAAYSKAADIGVKYYYGKDVSDVYKKMKLSRGSFNDWTATGDYKADEASYTEILNKVLDGNNSTLTVGGVQDDKPPYLNLPVATCWLSMLFGGDCGDDGTYQADVSEGEAETITRTVSENTKKYIIDWHEDTCDKQVSDGAGGTKTEYYQCQKADYDDTETKRAAELLNTAVSSGEPYLASSAFLGIEEPIQRARIGDNGPVNQVMNTLSTPSQVTYRNVATGEVVTKNQSIFETVNFQAAVGEKPYSTEEASSFARDRVLEVTGQADTDIIKKTTVSSNGRKNSSSAVRNGAHTPADYAIISKANESIDFAISKDNSKLFQSIVGANRIVEGGSFLSNNINLKVIGAMPSDAGTIAKYEAEVDEVMARKAEAERATLSPFDISSPNTFLGSIVHKLATSIVGIYGSGPTSIVSTIQASGDVAGESVANILGTATAEGADQKYTTLSPTNCKTVGAIAVEGDLYCTSHNTVSTDYMGYTMSDWKNSAIGASLDDDGKIKEDSDLEKFVTMGMDRESTVGTLNAEVCSTWHSYNDGLWDKFVHFFQDIVGLYEVCNGVEEGYATGAHYSFTSGQDDKLGLYSGYMLYNQVYSLLSEEDTSVSILRERYYKEHPLDDSEAGMIARISGMTKHEAEIALSYADYLNEIASYDPAGRYVFNEVAFFFEVERPVLETHSNKIAGDILAWYQKETSYKKMRESQGMTA